MSNMFDAVPFKKAVLAVFGVVVDNCYTELSYHSIEDMREIDNPDELRCQFDEAISETLYALDLPNDAVTREEVGDLVLEVYTDLRTYFEETAER